MKIIIAGAGDVGFHLAKQLSAKNHHITIIDPDIEKIENVNNAAQVLSIQGSAASFSNLLKAQVRDADLFLAVTSNEAVNLTCSIIAKKLGAKQTVARVSDTEFIVSNDVLDFAEIGVDHVICPEDLSAREIAKLIERAAATDIHEFENGKLTLLGLKLDESTPILHVSIQDLMKDLGKDITFRIVLIKRGTRTLIPSRELQLISGDQIIFMTTSEGIPTILKMAGKEKTHYNNIMILGGGKIGRACARMLQDKFNVKLVESDTAKALDLADLLEKTLIIKGDGRSMDLLVEEGISDMDAFIAVTEDAETNIISSLMARKLGVKKTIVYVENPEYTQLTRAIGIDALINKKLIAANYIARLVRQTEIVALINIQGMDAEVLEFVVPEGALVTKGQIKDLKFPSGAIIGGVIRGEDAFIAVGNTQIHANDRAVVFVMPGVESAVEKFFKK